MSKPPSAFYAIQTVPLLFHGPRKLASYNPNGLLQTLRKEVAA
jgi:hypothetical protein